MHVKELFALGGKTAVVTGGSAGLGSADGFCSGGSRR